MPVLLEIHLRMYDVCRRRYGVASGPYFWPAPQSGETEEKVDIDLILHLGMIALGWSPDQFRFETIARRDGYDLPGDDGQYVDSKAIKELGLPETSTPSLNIEAAWRKVKDKFPITPVLIRCSFLVQIIDGKHRMSPCSSHMMQAAISVNFACTHL